MTQIAKRANFSKIFGSLKNEKLTGQEFKDLIKAEWK